MQRYQILIEYVGTSFIGWQAQKKGKSIQKTVQSILSKLLKQKVILYASGRTDAGVHALEQSAHFDAKKKIQNINRIVKSLNFFLNDKMISIIKIKKKNINFHARHSAKQRTYVYLILNRFSPSTINKNREWHIRKKLDIKLIKKGAKKLIGTHDFSTFRSSSCGAKSPIKTLKKVSIKKNKNKFILKFTSKSFLQQQVRSMVGCIKYLGEGKWSQDDFAKAFSSKSRLKCAPPAPSCGLYLKKVLY